MKPPNYILPIIVISQFCCTSLWFAGNGILVDLIEFFEIKSQSLGLLTSSVQFGFIIGTLVFAIFSIADRFSPSKVFFTCSILAGLFNCGIIWENNTYLTILLLRSLTGFFLAGIYPVGMKIASDYFEAGLGKSLGFLVGALVLGTALPHLISDLKGDLPWKAVLVCTTGLAIIGGILIFLFVPNGPFRKTNTHIDFSTISDLFKVRKFKAAAFGYFGHMWELYAFWAFIPIILQMYIKTHPELSFNIPLLSFITIGVGALGCILSGYFSLNFGTKRVAFISLLLSALCCLLSPLMFQIDTPLVFIVFLIFWGIVVIADSPLFSTMVANNSPEENRGTALTIVNCIGFSNTIISIQLLNYLNFTYNSTLIFTVLAFGPILGLIALKRNL